MVEVLKDYSDTFPLVKALRSDLSNHAKPDTKSQEHSPGLKSPVGSAPRPIRKRLAPKDRQRLIKDYLDGALQRDLATRYGIGLSSVKTVLCEAGARKYMARAQAGREAGAHQRECPPLVLLPLLGGAEPRDGPLVLVQLGDQHVAKIAWRVELPPVGLRELALGRVGEPLIDPRGRDRCTGTLGEHEQGREATLGRIREFLAIRPETAEGEFTLPMQTAVLRVQRL
jgi:hypothetical protein